ncbi:Uncharacterized protein Fot_26747 [Forsythia ovata]|uniref:Uncharacterized protein n=1 Tax=Forsythia ovata TaxID=205694 RepID=A0ABD1UCR2_9LAMI
MATSCARSCDDASATFLWLPRVIIWRKAITVIWVVVVFDDAVEWGLYVAGDGVSEMGSLCRGSGVSEMGSLCRGSGVSMSSREMEGFRLGFGTRSFGEITECGYKEF